MSTELILMIVVITISLIGLTLSFIALQKHKKLEQTIISNARQSVQTNQIMSDKLLNLINSNISDISKIVSFKLDQNSSHVTNFAQGLSNQNKELAKLLVSNKKEISEIGNTLFENNEKISSQILDFKNKISTDIKHVQTKNNTKLNEISESLVRLIEQSEKKLLSQLLVVTNDSQKNLVQNSELKKLVSFIQHSLVFTNHDTNNNNKIIEKGKVAKHFTPGKLEKIVDSEKNITITYEYPNDNTIISKTFNNSILTTEVHHSPLGKPLLGKHFDKNGNITETFNYDELGQVITA